MTTHELLNIRKLLLEVKRKDDCDGLSVDELDNLLSAVNSEVYYKELTKFRDHLVASFPSGDADSNEDAWTAFHEEDWRLTYGGKYVTVHNNEVFFNAILSALNFIICEE